MKTTYKVITKSSVVNLPTKSQVRRWVESLHRIGLHNKDIKIEESMTNS